MASLAISSCSLAEVLVGSSVAYASFVFWFLSTISMAMYRIIDFGSQGSQDFAVGRLCLPCPAAPSAGGGLAQMRTNRGWQQFVS